MRCGCMHCVDYSIKIRKVQTVRENDLPVFGDTGEASDLNKHKSKPMKSVKAS